MKLLWASKRNSAAITFSFSFNITFDLPPAKRNLGRIHKGVVQVPKATASFPRSSIKSLWSYGKEGGREERKKGRKEGQKRRAGGREGGGQAHPLPAPLEHATRTWRATLAQMNSSKWSLSFLVDAGSLHLEICTCGMTDHPMLKDPCRAPWVS